jgi:hypothetical protein
MPTVAVFRDWLLPLSETFVRSQVDVLSKFQAVYVGCRSVARQSRRRFCQAPMFSLIEGHEPPVMKYHDD